MKKYELILLSKTIQRLRDVKEVSLFLNELFDKQSKEKYFLTYELTLLVYNIALNIFTDYFYFFDKELNDKAREYVIHILQQLYDNQLNADNITKITNDINFIQKYKKYTYISDLAVYFHYFFF